MTLQCHVTWKLTDVYAYVCMLETSFELCSNWHNFIKTKLFLEFSPLILNTVWKNVIQLFVFCSIITIIENAIPGASKNVSSVWQSLPRGSSTVQTIRWFDMFTRLVTQPSTLTSRKWNNITQNIKSPAHNVLAVCIRLLCVSNDGLEWRYAALNFEVHTGAHVHLQKSLTPHTNLILNTWGRRLSVISISSEPMSTETKLTLVFSRLLLWVHWLISQYLSNYRSDGI